MPRNVEKLPFAEVFVNHLARIKLRRHEICLHRTGIGPKTRGSVGLKPGSRAGEKP